jgi:hypothetical protein
MSELAQVKATIPKELKRKAFATFALKDEKFNRWLERELRAYVQESGALEPYARKRSSTATFLALQQDKPESTDTR